MNDIFLNDLPNHELYGYSDLKVGDRCEVDLISQNKTPKEIQIYVHAYAQYAKKKFKTKALNGVLHIKRVK